MAIPHASSGELIDIRPLNNALESAITKTLYKTDQLEVFRMVLLAGKEMPLHSVPGEVTVQCLEGVIEFTVAGTSELMRAGSLKCLAGGAAHALKAVEDSSVLVTLVLQASPRVPARIDATSHDAIVVNGGFTTVRPLAT